MRIPPADDHASAYHSLMVGIMEFLFWPHLTAPNKEAEHNEGRKRIDILYTNVLKRYPGSGDGDHRLTGSLNRCFERFHFTQLQKRKRSEFDRRLDHRIVIYRELYSALAHACFVRVTTMTDNNDTIRLSDEELQFLRDEGLDLLAMYKRIHDENRRRLVREMMEALIQAQGAIDGSH